MRQAVRLLPLLAASLLVATAVMPRATGAQQAVAKAAVILSPVEGEGSPADSTDSVHRRRSFAVVACPERSRRAAQDDRFGAVPAGITRDPASTRGINSTEGIPSIAGLMKLVASQELSAQAATDDPIGYGWDLFFYTNWRALPGPGDRGAPDPTKPFGQMGGPVVWETWKNTAEVYLPTGGTPASWTTAEPVPPDVSKITLTGADSGDDWQHMTDDVQVDGFNLLDTNDQKILYEILMSRDTFGYIRTGTLYNVQGQMQWASTKGALDFPWSAMEVKAAWRWIDPNDTACPAGNYFTTKAWYQLEDNNGNPIGYRTGLMGLTGLHIISKALPGWVWITFEQVDNAKCTKVKRKIPIDAAVATVNQQMQKALQGTKWAHYEMVGVQTGWGTAEKPTLLGNTQIESAFQTRSSCSTCHGIANVATAKPADPTVPIRRSFVDPQSSPPYFIGPPPSLGTYKSQDFVWSLRKAYWAPPPPAANATPATTTEKQ